MQKDLLDTIRKRRDACGLTPSRLAIEAGLLKDTLRAMNKDAWNPTFRTITAVLAALDRLEAKS